jgi:hypothetical protein
MGLHKSRRIEFGAGRHKTARFGRRKFLKDSADKQRRAESRRIERGSV